MNVQQQDTAVLEDRLTGKWYEPFSLLKNIIRGNIIHNWPGAFQVMRLLTIHKMQAGLLPEDHPWITGLQEGTTEYIWPQNIVFRTPVGTTWAVAGYQPEPDDDILVRVGTFLAAMVRKSVPDPEIPHGPKRRMPHAINYLHGAVHYNGLWVVFNHFEEAKQYIADPKFREALKHMIRQEKREVTFVFRERNYDPVEFAYFSAFIMSHLPWYANVNGAQKRVMWGNASPYPALNIINGSWLHGVEALRKGRYEQLVRVPVDASLYFQGAYGIPAREYHFIERMHAYLINNWVRKRGFDAGLFFVDRKKIEPRQYKRYKEEKQHEPVNEYIPNPLRKNR